MVHTNFEKYRPLLHAAVIAARKRKLPLGSLCVLALPGGPMIVERDILLRADRAADAPVADTRSGVRLSAAILQGTANPVPRYARELVQNSLYGAPNALKVILFTDPTIQVLNLGEATVLSLVGPETTGGDKADG